MLRTRMFCMTACSIMQNHPDSFVQSEGIYCLQQLHIFAPNVVNLSTLVPFLCNILLSPHLLLRKASIECLRQLAHREAKEISQWSKSIIANNSDIIKKMFIANRGLEGDSSFNNCLYYCSHFNINLTLCFQKSILCFISLLICFLLYY